MLTNVTQRWEERRASYRPAGEVIRTSEYDVEEIPDDATARAFIEQHHYSGSYPAARFRFALTRHGHRVGIAVFSHPVSNRTLTNVFNVHPLEATELGRFVLLDEVPGNGESWFASRCLDALRKKAIVDHKTGQELRGIMGVVSFSDPMPRRGADGKVVLSGHWGCIYQALSATYLGRGDGRKLHLLPDGRIFNHRTEQKIRKMEQGWKSGVAELQSYGAGPLNDDTVSWLEHWLPQITRPLRHHGNHKYAFGLSRHARRDLVTAAKVAAEKACVPALRYPKAVDPEAA